MKAKFYLGPRDGAEEKIQTSNGFAPKLIQYAATYSNKPAFDFYDLQEVKEGIAYYKYRCTV